MNRLDIRRNGPLLEVRFFLKGEKETFFEMLTSFKEALSDRKWEPAQKIWTVPMGCRDELLEWALSSGTAWFEDVSVDGNSIWGSTSGSKSSASGGAKSGASSGKTKGGPTDFDDFEDLGGDNAQGTSPAKDSPYAVLYLTPDAPPELVTRVWKFLMTTNHPDKGGDTERCAQINQAYQQLKAIGGTA